MEIVLPYANQFVLGTLMTVRLALGALALGLFLGLIGATAKLSKDPVARALADVYTMIVRGIPELLVVLIIYYGSAGALTTLAEWVGYDEYIDLSPYAAGVIALGFMFGAYATEVFRGAILAIPKGQVEAAHSFGMGGFLTFRRIILPQIWRVALPGLGNLFLVLMKDTALVSVIGLSEIMRVAKIGGEATKNAFAFYLTAAAIYLVLTVVSMRAQVSAEVWANKGVPKGVR